MSKPLLPALFTAEAMRATDHAAINDVGIPSGHLMERAGLAVAREIIERYEPRDAVVFAGKGNNGGDGFVVARELAEADAAVTVYTLAPDEAYTAEAALNLRILRALGTVEVLHLFGGEAPLESVELQAAMADVVVDAIFGTGFRGAASGEAAAAIELINDACSPVVSVDIASGVDASTGRVEGPVVMADLTVALHAPKVGHFVTPGGISSGEVVVVAIGIPSGCNAEAQAWLLTEEVMAELLVPKGALSHKRSVGTLTVVGGAAGMGGAARLAGVAALRAGGGLTRVLRPAGSPAAAGLYPELIELEVPGEAGEFCEASAERLKAEASALGALVLGPGYGRGGAAQHLAAHLMLTPRPLLLDADGLYALGADGLELLTEREQPTVLTPHEGEMARLLALSPEQVAADRLGCARLAAERGRCVVVLKGEGTVVADHLGAAFVVPTGNPGLATPGTGDVLSGVIGAQLAKGLGALDAACLGAYLHGLAADLAAERAVGTEGMLASDLLDFLPAAIEQLKSDQEEARHEHH